MTISLKQFKKAPTMQIKTAHSRNPTLQGGEEVKDINNIIVFGDWHGDKKFALQALHVTNHLADIYLHVGDFGIWPEEFAKKGFITKVEEKLAEQNKELWFIDGNHEDFDILDNLQLDERGLGKVTEHIYHIPRGHVWNWSGKTFMGLGGAVSIDRHLRTLGTDYFTQEEITDANIDTAIQNLKNSGSNKVDVLLTHENTIVPTNLFPTKLPGDVVKDNEANRGRIETLISTVSPKIHIHGHYHVAYVKQYNDDFTVFGLNKNGSGLNNNYLQLQIGDI